MTYALPACARAPLQANARTDHGLAVCWWLLLAMDGCPEAISGASRRRCSDCCCQSGLLLQAQMGADCLRLEVKCAPELVAGVRGVTPECYPLTMAAHVLMAAACLDVVLTHEADDVADFNDQVVAMVADASDCGDSVPWALDLWPGKALAVKKEPKAVCRCLD